MARPNSGIVFALFDFADSIWWSLCSPPKMISINSFRFGDERTPRMMKFLSWKYFVSNFFIQICWWQIGHHLGLSSIAFAVPYRHQRAFAALPKCFQSFPHISNIKKPCWCWNFSAENRFVSFFHTNILATTRSSLLSPLQYLFHMKEPVLFLNPFCIHCLYSLFFFCDAINL